MELDYTIWQARGGGRGDSQVTILQGILVFQLDVLLIESSIHLWVLPAPCQSGQRQILRKVKSWEAPEFEIALVTLSGPLSITRPKIMPEYPHPQTDHIHL